MSGSGDRLDSAAPERTAVVTGGGSGIGLACAAALARRGMRGALVGRRRNRLEAAAAGLAVPGVALAADLTEPGAPERVAERALEALGRIDVLVHAAGVFETQPVPDFTPESWRRVLDLNLGAVAALTAACWEALSASEGQVVLISSIAAVQAFEGDAAYAASKAGMNAYGEVLRLEGRNRGIRVITLCPAQIDTELWDGKAPDEVRARMMPVEAVGELTAYLVGLDRRIDVAPVAIRPVRDPWQEPE